MPVIQIEDTKLTFKLNDYDSQEDYAQVTLKVENRYMNYCKSGQLLDTDEVEWIIQTLNDLLDDKLTEVTRLTFTEPDLTIICYPAQTAAKKEGLNNRKSRHYAVESYIDFTINFPNGCGYSNEKWTVTLSRDKICELTEGLERETCKGGGTEETVAVVGVSFAENPEDIHWYFDNLYSAKGQYVYVKTESGERLALVEFTRTYRKSKLPCPFESLKNLIRRAAKEEIE